MSIGAMPLNQDTNVSSTASAQPASNQPVSNGTQNDQGSAISQSVGGKILSAQNQLADNTATSLGRSAGAPAQEDGKAGGGAGTQGAGGKLKTSQLALGGAEGGSQAEEKEEPKSAAGAQGKAQGNPANQADSNHNQTSVTIQAWGKGNKNDSVWSALKNAGWSDQEIANNHLVDQVAKQNNLQDPNNVQAGQKLIVPTKPAPSSRPQSAQQTSASAPQPLSKAGQSQGAQGAAAQQTSANAPQPLSRAVQTSQAAQAQPVNPKPWWQVQGNPLTGAQANLVYNDRVNAATGGQVFNYAANNGTLTPSQMRQEVNQYMSTLTPAQRQDLLNRAYSGGSQFSQQYGMTQYGGIGAYLAANGQNDAERHIGADLYLSNKMAIAQQLGMIPPQSQSSGTLPHGPGVLTDPKNGNLYAMDGTLEGTYNGLPYYNDPQLQNNHPGYVVGNPTKEIGETADGGGVPVKYGQSYLRIQGYQNGLPIVDVGQQELPPSGFTGYLRRPNGQMDYVSSSTTSQGGQS